MRAELFRVCSINEYNADEKNAIVFPAIKLESVPEGRWFLLNTINV